MSKFKSALITTLIRMGIVALILVGCLVLMQVLILFLNGMWALITFVVVLMFAIVFATAWMEG